jgi:hypothetical protein
MLNAINNDISGLTLSISQRNKNKYKKVTSPEMIIMFSVRVISFPPLIE